MTTASRGTLTAFLLRTGFLMAALAIIAGIFGMHIMTGAHHVSAAHSMPAAETGHAMQLHAGPGGHAPADGVDAMTGGSASSCAATGGCPEASGGGNPCVLAPGDTALSAPMPGEAPYELPDFGAAAVTNSTYAYSPDSPSPGDLCISRT